MLWPFATKVAPACCDGRCVKYDSECVCDLHLESNAKTDWAIARLVGTATYAQLLDAGPGLFHPFEDWRSDGGAMTTPFHIGPLRLFGGVVEETDHEVVATDAVPFPPNLVSTVLADGLLTVPGLKRLLLDAAYRCLPPDPRIEPLIHTTIEYTYPIVTVAEILLTFVVVTLVVSVVVASMMRLIRAGNIYLNSAAAKKR